MAKRGLKNDIEQLCETFVEVFVVETHHICFVPVISFQDKVVCETVTMHHRNVSPLAATRKLMHDLLFKMCKENKTSLQVLYIAFIPVVRGELPWHQRISTRQANMWYLIRVQYWPDLLAIQYISLTLLSTFSAWRQADPLPLIHSYTGSSRFSCSFNFPSPLHVWAWWKPGDRPARFNPDHRNEGALISKLDYQKYRVNMNAIHLISVTSLTLSRAVRCECSAFQKRCPRVTEA